MKIAVLYSGICRGNWIKNHTSVKHHFKDADYYFATWHDHVQSMPAVKYKSFAQPEMHYHPTLDVPESSLTWKLKQNNKQCRNDVNYRTRIMNHTKQILAHALQMRVLQDKYEMIVRVRYDTYLSPKVDLNPWLEKSLEENCAVGFGTRTSRHPNLHELKEVEQIYTDGRTKAGTSHDWSKYIMDPMIFHPQDLFNPDYVFELHESKKLLPAENGWYQVLSEPYGDNHRCVYGGAQIEKYLPQTVT